MAEAPRISPADARRKLESGAALLVCAYDDENTCREKSLEGAVTMQELQARLAGLSKDTELVFYCA